ncbi:MAG: hypothetical protein ACRDDY_09650 [Clostridium sp.]|uniref:hypothetical protein n=1 Tax=Clostridium sp. TaxID=1506 RepID=UPI003EE4AE35
MFEKVKNFISARSTIEDNKNKYGSCYDNTLKNVFFTNMKVILLGIFTLGFAYPWMICIKERSKYSHTVINGKRLKFIGNPKDLLYHWFFWYFLIIITIGLYGIVVHFKFKQWETSNVIFEDVLELEEISEK